MAINLRDYSRTAAQRGWGVGWPSCGGAKAAGTAVVTADRSGTRVSVHKRISRLVDMLLDWTEHPAGGNYLLKPGQCGGYNCRPISGTNSASNHSWGLALDLNWSDNPYTTTGQHTIPRAVIDKWNRYGFASGADYSGAKKDWMHEEFMGAPQDADAMTALALRELSGGSEDMPLSNEDVRRIADAVLDTPINRQGNVPNAGKAVSLRGIVAWFDAVVTHAPMDDGRAQKMAADVAAMRERLGG